MRLAVFGCGSIYEKYKNYISDRDEILAILDNDVTMHGSKKDGYIRIYPRELNPSDIDRVIIMSDSATEMKEQLLRLSFPACKIFHYRDFLGELKPDIKLYPCMNGDEKFERTLLIISNKLGHHGGAMVSLRTAVAAKRMGYKVTIATSDTDDSILKEVTEAGIEVIIQTDIEHSSENNLEWVKKYDVVLINTFPMILCAIKIAKFKRVNLWLHENPDMYQTMDYWHEEIQYGLHESKIEIQAVTKRAKENFLRFYAYRKDIGIMPVPINDYSTKIDVDANYPNECLRVLLSGVVIERKGYEYALDALDRVNEPKSICLYSAGKSLDDDYSHKVLKRIRERADSKYLGEKSTEDMMELYSVMDLVIVPSTEETFSMVAAEAMMMGKPCIVSDHCGITEYIKNGVNGFVFPRGNADSLAQLLKWCMENRKKLEEIGQNARKTYESYFSDDIFEGKLKNMLMISDL